MVKQLGFTAYADYMDGASGSGEIPHQTGIRRIGKDRGWFHTNATCVAFVVLFDVPERWDGLGPASALLSMWAGCRSESSISMTAKLPLERSVIEAPFLVISVIDPYF